MQNKLKNKKIALLTPTFYRHSGIDRVVQQQAEEYSKSGNRVTVIALDGDIQNKGYGVIKLGMPKNPLLQRIYRLFFFLDIKKLHYYKKLKKFDIVISHFYPMNWLAYMARKKYKIKYIYFNHGINTTGLLNSRIQKTYMNIFSFFTNVTLKNADEAFSVSDYLRNDLKKFYGLDSKVVYNKIDKKRFNKNVNGDKIIKQYNLKNNKILLYVGRIAPHKGIHLLLKSFKIIKKEVKGAKLIIVGKPAFNIYYKKQKNFAIKNFLADDVVFAGFVPDDKLPFYYAACDVYATCSLWEGFNLPAAEAQACGKRVVAFNIGPHPEIVKKGILVEKGNIKEFSDAVIKILKNEN